MGKIANKLKAQLLTANTKSSGNTKNEMPVANALANAVEFFGVIAIFGGAGWVAYREFHSIIYFVVLVMFGTLTTVLKLYYQTKLGLDEAFDEAIKRRKYQMPNSPKGLQGFLEADLLISPELEEKSEYRGGQVGLPKNPVREKL